MTTPEMRFQHWSAQHFAILALTFLIPIGLVSLTRRDSEDGMARVIRFTLAGILVVNFLAYVTYRIHSGFWELRYDLPMEFCNWATGATILALITQNRTAGELSYFWVLAGSANGVFTPDLQVSFPHTYFFIFWIAHSGLVVAALYAVVGLRLYPRPGSVWRTMLASQVYFVTALAANILLNANYGYLRHKPDSGSLLDHLGPWPHYIAAMQVLALGIFAVLYVPFFFRNRSPNALASMSSP